MAGVNNVERLSYQAQLNDLLTIRYYLSELFTDAYAQYMKWRAAIRDIKCRAQLRKV
jgi:hypothetical protein